MIEKVIGLDLPPGLRNNGTVMQSKDRWFAGNLVRFYQGNIQPVGGHVQRTLTGATITGTANYAHSWQLNDGTVYIAIGTTTGLWLVTSDNVVHDILPVGLVGGTPYTWQLDNMGSYLIAVYNLTESVITDSLNVLAWKGDPDVAAVQAFGPPDGPSAAFGCVVTPERFLFIIRGSDPNGAAHRVPSGALVDPTDPADPTIVQ